MMVALTLKDIRKELGFTTARSFYQDYLSKKAQLDFNYSYYMKIEGGRALPSSTVISIIAGTLNANQQQLLIMAYCRQLFPVHAKLFNDRASKNLAPRSSQKFALTKPATPQPTLMKQRYLNESQVATVTKSREHYYLFLILTLARVPVALKDLVARLKTVGPANVERLLNDLQGAQLADVDDGFANCIVNEMKFPKAETDGLIRMYADIDRWSLEFAKALGFDETLEKMMVRRVSGRYLGLLTAQAQLLFDSLKAFDEIDVALNDDVILLNFTMARGTLPG